MVFLFHPADHLDYLGCGLYGVFEFPLSEIGICIEHMYIYKGGILDYAPIIIYRRFCFFQQ